MDNMDSDKELNNFISSMSNAEKLGWGLVIFSFIVGTWGLEGEFAIIGVIMAVIASLIGLIKKNWILLIIGVFDVVLLVSYMSDLAYIKGL